MQLVKFRGINTKTVNVGSSSEVKTLSASLIPQTYAQKIGSMCDLFVNKKSKSIFSVG